MDKEYNNSGELWADVTDDRKERLRRHYSGLSDSAIRSRLWKRRNWRPLPPTVPCKCHKLHVKGCPNPNFV